MGRIGDHEISIISSLGANLAPLPVINSDFVGANGIRPKNLYSLGASLAPLQKGNHKGLPLPTATPSSIDGKLDSNSEKLDDEIYYNVHTLEGKAGEQITIDLISSDFDPFLGLLDSEGNLVGDDNDGGEGNNARIIVILPKDGTYQIVAVALEGKTGNYTLSWHATTENDLKLAEAEQLTDQAYQLYQQGKYAEATSLAQRALAIREEVLGAKHLDTATSLNNLALLYYAQGNYSAAEPLYLRALSIREEVLGAKHPLTASSLNNLALLYKFQGNYSAAEPLYLRALSIVEEVLGAKHPHTATCLNNLAGLYKEQGNYSAAEPLFIRALAIHEEVLGPKHPDTAASLNNLALLYQFQGNYSAAEPLFIRALSIVEEVFGAKHPLTATSLNNLAVLYQSQGNYRAAEPLYLRALAIVEEVLGAKHPDTATSLNNLAWLYYAQGNTPLALTYFTRGTDIEEYNLDLNLATGSERQKRDYMATISSTTDFTISLHLQAAPENPEAARLALTTLLRRKARILDVLGDSLQTLRDNLTPESQKLLDELISTRSQLAALFYNPPKNLSSEQYKAQFNNLKTKEEQLEATLARQSAQFRKQNEPVTIEAVQKLIPADAVLVEIVLYKPFDAKTGEFGKPRYAAYLLDSTGQIQWVDLGEAEPIDKAMFNFRQALQNDNSDIKPLARQLDEKLMQPIRQKLSNSRHILLSPDSQLNLIPFAALVDENNQYLVQNYTITYLTTGRDLIQLSISSPSQQSPVILANPDFEKGNHEGLPLQDNDKAKRGSDNRRSDDIASLNFGSLPGTKVEADAISQLLPDVTLLTKSEATENALKQVKSPKILHMATHGFFLQDVELFSDKDNRGVGVFPRYPSSNSENPLLRSGIALAGFNSRQSGTEDGVLTALEATSLNLYGTKLVVLSACETGVGDIANGEGVYGLRRAFVLAGSESQIVSLWKLHDDATKDLMVEYYQRILRGEGRSQALRQVQLEMLNSSEQNHPYYWAAFLPSGDWRAME